MVSASAASPLREPVRQVLGVDGQHRHDRAEVAAVRDEFPPPLRVMRAICSTLPPGRPQAILCLAAAAATASSAAVILGGPRRARMEGPAIREQATQVVILSYQSAGLVSDRRIAAHGSRSAPIGPSPVLLPPCHPLFAAHVALSCIWPGSWAWPSAAVSTAMRRPRRLPYP